MAPTTLHDVELWNGVHTWCAGFRDNLPWWKHGDAPAELVTLSQLWEQKLRRRRGQEPFGLLVFHHRQYGEQVAELFRIDEAIASRTMTPRWRASIEAMQRAHRTCSRCGREFKRYLATSTWTCWECMERTGDFGEPGGSRRRPRKPPPPHHHTATPPRARQGRAQGAKSAAKPTRPRAHPTSAKPQTVPSS